MAKPGEMERDLLSCSICLDLFKDPKTLTCMHRFCESCLGLHIVTSNARASKSTRGFSCPECREFIPAPDKSSHESAWATQFKTDFKLKNLVENYESKQETKADKVSNPCPKHGDREQELYCFDCSAAVCCMCAISSHKACSEIRTVTEAAGEIRSSCQAYIQQIPHLEKETLQLEKNRETYTTEINTKKASVDKEIKEQAERMRQIVTREEEKLLTRAQTQYDQLNQTVLVLTEHINHLKFLEYIFSSKLKTLSDLELVMEKQYIDSMGLCMKQKAVQTERCSHLYNLVSKLEWKFLPLDPPCTNLGNIVFKE